MSRTNRHEMEGRKYYCKHLPSGEIFERTFSRDKVENAGMVWENFSEYDAFKLLNHYNQSPYWKYWV